MLADDVIAAQEQAREVPPFSERHPGLSAAAGYEAARALHAHRVALGWVPVGRKVGFTNRTLWERYGVHEPMWGMVYDRTLVRAMNDRASVPLAGLVQPRIEPEIAFRLKRAPFSSDPAHLLDCLEWLAHSVEIVQCHHPEWKVTIADCCADNGLHGRLIVGTPVPAEEVPELAQRLPQVAVTLFKGDEPRDRGVGANVLGSPLLSLGYLVELLKNQPQAAPLRAGEIVTTGVLTDAHPVRPGETWHTSLDGLPLPGLTIELT
jgi:2-oxo-3-hexenedioate decarboxylase